mmetsp:Transcript_35666/g.42992  ORF Transcript_35666/g.42992 Transcript_35666/m.42992 type:complete len:186 (+) Transcript_35666:155-712(+)|eukprot:CAMPEP_0197857056 /NCGR_PEP_ID=MMETSP1438-20131217/29777_1 /TAXON_ID=1461541 /ORGANISM="Pterosperma sp., Strain CCMP1384" /LENGTH=185 /DNA_ID=CAMNT_0043472747 /DNA_START=126 /DNA_END=683 /DNA_ORIENTATION=+
MEALWKSFVSVARTPAFAVACWGVSCIAYSRYIASARPRDGLSSMRVCALRLRPGQEIKDELLKVARNKNLRAGCVLTCVGSVTGACLRLANATADNPNEIINLNNKHEICSLVGTLSRDGTCHLHASLGDAEGKVVGGHVMGDMKVFTTAEIVLGECEDLEFIRPHDPATGFPELEVLYCPLCQ